VTRVRGPFVPCTVRRTSAEITLWLPTAAVTRTRWLPLARLMVGSATPLIRWSVATRDHAPPRRRSMVTSVPSGRPPPLTDAITG
jgi:hypothetical protein